MAAAGPFGLGPMELVIILLVLVMLFGATRLADLGGSLGKGIKEFRTAVKDEDEETPANSAQNGGSANSAPAENGNAGATGTVAAVKCGNCSALNEAGAKHCNQCGTTIAAPVT